MTTVASFRYYIGSLREEALLWRLSAILDSATSHGFQVKSVEPHHKDGGVFVRFGYNMGASEDSTLKAILEELKESAAKHGGIPSWSGFPTGNVWLVEGKPWREVSLFILRSMCAQNMLAGSEPLCISDNQSVFRRPRSQGGDLIQLIASESIGLTRQELMVLQRQSHMVEYLT